MWTEADRSTYRQTGDCLPSDLSDAEWDRLAPLIPAAKPGGRPRKTDMRSAMNAIFFLLRTGCPWRYLPGGIFPPRSTVYNIFRAFQRQGVWEAIWEELRAALRERLDLLSYGCGTLARDLLRDGLLDELHLNITPVVAGRGRRLFDEPAGMLAFDLADSRTYPTGAVHLVCRPHSPAQNG